MIKIGKSFKVTSPTIKCIERRPKDLTLKNYKEGVIEGCKDSFENCCVEWGD